ncbi:hypothetical protein HYR54_05490 [Candidatus Acetothermia bacterium]|nr:hypothetical protein [Candidatus Acetothermia bacterium]
MKINPDGKILGTFSTGGTTICDRGVAVTPQDNNVWVANSGGIVSRLDNNGNLLKVIPVGNFATGVAVDPAGKVWVTNLGSDNAMRIDPATNKVDFTVDFGPGARPYNYSDMTGTGLRTVARSGTWTVTFDSLAPNTAWRKVCWTSVEPSGTSVVISAASSNDKSNFPIRTPVQNCIDLGSSSSLNGQFILVQVKLNYPRLEGEGFGVSSIRN